MNPTERVPGADSAFKAQVNAQTERITAELNKLEQLLLAGMVDRRVLISFREAVNRIRQTSWSVQQSLDGVGEGGLPSMLLRERVRVTEQLAIQIGRDIAEPDINPNEQELESLRRALDSLSTFIAAR
jgi:predicted metal-dependent TIM-barrel fold hydrolase